MPSTTCRACGRADGAPARLPTPIACQARQPCTARAGWAGAPAGHDGSGERFGGCIRGQLFPAATQRRRARLAVPAMSASLWQCAPRLLQQLRCCGYFCRGRRTRVENRVRRAGRLRQPHPLGPARRAPHARRAVRRNPDDRRRGGERAVPNRAQRRAEGSAGALHNAKAHGRVGTGAGLSPRCVWVVSTSV